MTYAPSQVPKNLKKARKILKRAVELGNVDAMHRLGMLYNDDDSDSHRDKEKAIQLWRMAANRGHCQSQYTLSIALGIRDQFEDAFHWVKVAAEQGMTDAEVDVGNCLRTGNGVEPDIHEAIRWYARAAAKGDANAINALEEMPLEEEAEEKDAIYDAALARAEEKGAIYDAALARAEELARAAREAHARADALEAAAAELDVDVDMLHAVAQAMCMTDAQVAAAAGNDGDAKEKLRGVREGPAFERVRAAAARLGLVDEARAKIAERDAEDANLDDGQVEAAARALALSDAEIEALDPEARRAITALREDPAFAGVRAVVASRPH